MKDAFMTAVEMVFVYLGDSWQYAVFAAALLYLLFEKEEKKTNRLLIGYTLVFAFVYFCPLTAKVIMDYCIGKDVYWRMMWLYPVPIVIACAGTKLTMRFKKTICRILAAVLVTASIVSTGTCVYTAGDTFQKAENINKLPNTVVDICHQLREFAGEKGYIRVIAPYELVSDIRQYDASIRLAYGRRSESKTQQWLLEAMLAPEPDFAAITEIDREKNTNYLIYPTTDEQHEALLKLGFEQIGQHEPYRIYHDTMINPKRRYDKNYLKNMS